MTPVIRQLWPVERYHIRDHLLRLETSDRRMRFGGTANDEYIKRYVDELDWCRHLAIGAFVSGILRGTAECHIVRRRGPLEAELAFSVERFLQSQGVGGLLVGRALNMVRNRGIRKLFIVGAPDNAPVRRLANRYGMTLRLGEEMEGSIMLRRASLATIAQELSEELLAWMHIALHPYGVRIPLLEPFGLLA